MDMLATAQRWLATVREDSLSTSRPLTYVVRDTNERIPMEGVVIGRNDERLDTTSESSLGVDERDYIIPAEVFTRRPRQYSFGPKRGDTIEEVDENYVTHVYRLMPYSGDVAYEWHDREQTAYRVHCQKVGVKE
jgi:hypothetical protein